jgi:hypothetical protein
VKAIKFNKSHAVILSFLVACAIPATQALAQTADVATAAKTACEKSAVDKGFTVSEVVSVEPKGTDGANVVLSLLREGNPYKLTCGYTVAGGASITEDTTTKTDTMTKTVTTTPVAAETNTGFPWWWLLLPILGLPLLFAWSKGRGEQTTVPTTRSYEAPRTYETGFVAKPYDVIVRNSGQTVNVYSGPATTNKVIDTLNDTQRVRASGRKDGAWTELASGGWVQTSYLSDIVV